MHAIRPANDGDIAPVATLFRAVRLACLPYLPDLHTPEEDLAYFRDHVFGTCEVWIAGNTEGFVAFRAGWVDHLYVRPDCQRSGIGATLLARAMTTYSPLRLWTFQKNIGAIKFYSARGFREIERSDGRRNEEREPDILFGWTRGQRP